MKICFCILLVLLVLGFPLPATAGSAFHRNRAVSAAPVSRQASEVCLVPASATFKRILPPGMDETRIEAAYQSSVFEGTPVRLSVDVQNTSTLTQSALITFTIGVQPITVTETLAPFQIATIALPDSAAQPTNGLVDWTRAEPGGELRATITADACAASQEIAIPIRPRPVALVHGFEGNARDWDQYQAYLREHFLVGGAVSLDMGPAQPWRRTKTIAQNAELLRDQIRDLQARTAAASLDVIAHSMGGLVTRLYIQRLMTTWGGTQRAVRQLVMLGTPNGGSPFAQMYARIGRSRPASDELTPSALIAFNHAITDTKSVTLRMIAGDAQPRGLLPGGDDCRVTLDSALAIPVKPANVRIIKRDNSCSGTILHTLLRTDRTIFEQNVLPFLQDSP